MHTATRSGSIFRLGSACLASALLSVCAASAVAAAVSPEVQTRYEHERERCLSGQSGQDQATCLKEAGAARDAAKHGELNDGNAKYRKNAKERCDVLTGDEHRDCISRMKGDANSSASGSVKGGGIIRETVTREVKPVDPAASAP